MEKEEAILKVKRGYLNGDFQYFHLADRKSLEFESHYHEFNKIIIFISGDVTYLIEGKAYKLKPWDLLFVGSNDVHRPIISADEPYERIIIWVNSRFLELHNVEGSNLLTCFSFSSRKKINLLTLMPENVNSIKATLASLEEAVNDNSFGSAILKNSLFLQFIVYINRLYLAVKTNKEESDVEYDKRISSILEYINKNLGDDLSVENIASKFYMSKYYLMHKFKTQTGYTLHNYIQQKRLMLSASLIKKGKQITEVSLECGFKDYSSFVRAFKKTFELSPKQYYKTMLEMENSYDMKKHR
ncbi:AraC family transcriptional regulator [Clostridium sp. CX1]|uniref:AraC family transcriptional regulator n=1 Tax=Clostridium sp. CX1 TaxID=2978346 RepID=UPI0021C0B80F|nr:AraC family transcriptional regulator [Clostridium sp. CX1]MCT8975239.1 AraC family transcriptional regulator [Clostridium sp. CX1]